MLEVVGLPFENAESTCLYFEGAESWFSNSIHILSTVMPYREYTEWFQEVNCLQVFVKKMARKKS